jgi:hypothetical protein
LNAPASRRRSGDGGNGASPYDVEFASTSKDEVYGEVAGVFMKIKKTGIKGGKVIWGT